MTKSNTSAELVRTGKSSAAAGRDRRRRRDERGAAAVEYAVVTVAAASLGGLLIKILTDPTVKDILLRLITALIEHFMKLS